MATKLLICGSRQASPAMLKYATACVVRAQANGWEIVVGDAAGVDMQAQQTACELGVPFLFYGATTKPRHWCCITHRDTLYRFVAISYLQRDCVMVDRADVVMAIWNGVSRGTKWTYDYAVTQGKTAYLKTFALEETAR